MASDQRQRKCYYQQQQQQQDGTNNHKEVLMMKKGGGGGGSGGGVGVEERVWKACAGNLVQIPALNSRAYYFPQGHLEQTSPTSPLSSLPVQVTSKPVVLCRVVHVSHLADPETDEVCAKIRLQPLVNSPLSSGPPAPPYVEEECRGGGDGVVSFAKVLTPSDANNGGGFSVPRFCADSIFPALDFNADPPVQNIHVKDVHGETWDFRHIYRGTPRRHLLTTGWSKFVNSKKLIAGDSVVFIKNTLTEELFVGVRRANKSNNNNCVANYGTGWAPPAGYMRNCGNVSSGKEKVVIEAVEKAASGMVFEVVYYPRPGVPEFVVAAERVEGALSVYWSTGMRVKMATETEDSSRLQWFQGTVKSVSVTDTGVFPRSTWRMLEVEWDEGDILKNMKRVSPWQVDYIAPTPPIHIPFPPNKKFRCSQNPGMLTDGEGEFPLPNIVGFSSMMGHLSPSCLSFNSFPAGMQGARQNHYFSIPSNIVTEGTHQMYSDGHMGSISQKVDAVSTDLNIGNSSPETPSPDSQNSVQFLSTATTKQQSHNFTGKAGITSFQLFGKTIHMEQPLTSTGEITCTEYNDSGAEGAGNTMDQPLVDAYKNLHDRLGSSSVVEAFVKG